MSAKKRLGYIKEVLDNMPSSWLDLTTHRLDIYTEKLAKTQFLDQFTQLYAANNSSSTALYDLPTAYDYIRLGHPLSCLLEWEIAQANQLQAEHVISFSSETIPIMAVLRTNLLAKQKTRIIYAGAMPAAFDADLVTQVYGYDFELKALDPDQPLSEFDGSTVFVSRHEQFGTIERKDKVDFHISIYDKLGSVIVIADQNKDYIPAIQHVRRRETIAITPANALVALKTLTGSARLTSDTDERSTNKALVVSAIKDITGSNSQAIVGSSGLSIQYAIMMGLVQNALENHQGKAIKFIVPPNCYGGTNDQARRVAACSPLIEVVDLPVDGGRNMVQSIDEVLETLAAADAVPYIIAEIPTNPRVEVPDLEALKAALSKKRHTKNGTEAIDPVFILDQTFCPNVHFLGTGKILATVRTISYVSGSKFPSGGLCTAGYCIGNTKTESLMRKIERQLQLCDNEATDQQLATLAQQMPSMIERIAKAYKNTRAFVNHIATTLPNAKINFVSEELAEQGFTPSVFSLDLPTKGATEAKRESYKRALNHQLIKMMITKIPDESKYCVSYGQLKGCYWTIPATSTQGTTKEGDKDYIARVALSPDMDLELHKKVFSEFVDSI